MPSREEQHPTDTAGLDAGEQSDPENLRREKIIRKKLGWERQGEELDAGILQASLLLPFLKINKILKKSCIVFSFL